LIDDMALKHWLLEHGGPAIRYRTATELMHESDGVDLERLTVDLLQYPMVREWLGRLAPLRSGNLFNLHGANPDAFENVCAKLCEFGIRAGMLEELDKGLLHYRRHLAQGDFLGKLFVVSPLNWMGYGGDEAVQAYLGRRLARMFALARSGVYDIYVDHDTFGDCPAAFRKRPLVNPEFYDRLPGIWDIYALAHYPEVLRRDEMERWIEAVVAYVLDPRYQALDEGYGYMRSGPRRYHSMGWSLHLPGYDGFDFTRAIHAAMFVQRVELMAHFPIARRSQWFRESLRHLEGFRTEIGTYRFPAPYLREQASGYWVQGAYMRLEQERRSRLSLETESTFRMLKIKQKGVYGDARAE
jgi:hypothetical protein